MGFQKGKKNLEGSLDSVKQAKADSVLSFQSQGQDYHRAGVDTRFNVITMKTCLRLKHKSLNVYVECLLEMHNPVNVQNAAIGSMEKNWCVN